MAHKSPRSKMGVLGRRLAENDGVKDKVIPVKLGTKYHNREGWATLDGSDLREDRSWSEGPSNEMCRGKLKVSSYPSSAYLTNWDFIRWERNGHC